MKILTVSLFVCAMMGLIRAAATAAGYNLILNSNERCYQVLPQEEVQYRTEGPTTPMNPFGGWKPSCPHGWTMFSSQCILYVPRKMTWAEAEENCRSSGGHLASVYSSNQAYDIQQEMQKFGHRRGPIWVGGYNTPENPFWFWSEHLFGAFHDWCRGEAAQPRNHCLQIKFEEHAMGCLDDMTCDARLPSVCGITIM